MFSLFRRRRTLPILCFRRQPTTSALRRSRALLLNLAAAMEPRPIVLSGVFAMERERVRGAEAEGDTCCSLGSVEEVAWTVCECVCVCVCVCVCMCGERDSNDG